LLIGEGVDPQVLASIRSIARADPAVAQVRKSLTMHFSPNDVLLTLDLGFKKHLTAEKIAAAVERLERAIRAQHPEIKHIFIEAKALIPSAGK
jgi:divalent metal cation (Fe/Co/Zn/Cd) transporter